MINPPVGKNFIARNFPAIIILIVVGILVGFPIIGLFSGEFLGNLLFAILLVSVITDIAIIISIIMKSGQRITQILWVAISIIVLVITGLITFPGENNIRDFHIVLGWELIILSFPASLVINYLVYFLSNLPVFAEMNIFYLLLITCLVYIVPGYLQWFVLFPFIEKKIRSS